MKNYLFILFVLFSTNLPKNCFILLLGAQDSGCDNFTNTKRIDCHPEENASPDKCVARGCCWRTPVSDIYGDGVVPFCYYPNGYNTYVVETTTPTPLGFTSILQKENVLKQWPNDILKLKLDYEKFLSANSSVIVEHIRIVDPNNTRWQPPIPIHLSSSTPTNRQQIVNFPNVGEIFQGVFVDSNRSMFTSKQQHHPHPHRHRHQDDFFSLPLIFTDQFIQISTYLPTGTVSVFGLGEQQRPFVHNVTQDWSRIALYTRDQPPIDNVNLYGVHNFFIGLIPGQSKAFGIFILNSNAQEILIQPNQPNPIITHRFIGGIIDYYIIQADHPLDVISKYWSLLGSPMLPPYWSLGFHLCRWGYKDVSEVQSVVDRNRLAGMPQDVQWTDIDYMDQYLDWTLKPNSYNNLGDFVNKLHFDYGMKYVPIVDPGISNTQPSGSYAPYDEGLKMGIFIKKYNSTDPIVGNVWPGTTVYPDFSHPNSLDWWFNSGLKPFYNQVAFDGLWIDMNEPASFSDGSTVGCLKNNLYDEPPFTPNILGNSLQSKTICPSSQTYLGPMYNLHNLYGYLEANVTNFAIKKLLPNKRVFLLTRSSFAGSGPLAFHWTGDNSATWDDLAQSIVQILNFNLFGMPMVGADICGFVGNTNEELCTRWMQLGAFYPFMRNHNAIGNREQDPAIWSIEAQKRIRSSLQLRYSLMLHLYSLLFNATRSHRPVIKALWMDFPLDKNTIFIEDQFLMGSSLMIVPALKPNENQRQAYFPQGYWCDLHKMNRFLIDNHPGKWTGVPLTMDNIPVYLRGGHIIPMQGVNINVTKATIQFTNATTTQQYRKLPLTLLSCASSDGGASGSFVWDDGVTTNAIDNNLFSEFQFSISNRNAIGGQKMIWLPQQIKYWNEEPLQLASIVVFGVSQCPRQVTVNQAIWHEFQCYNNSILSINQLNGAELRQIIQIDWSI